MYHELSQKEKLKRKIKEKLKAVAVTCTLQVEQSPVTCLFKLK